MTVDSVDPVRDPAPAAAVARAVAAPPWGGEIVRGLLAGLSVLAVAAALTLAFAPALRSSRSVAVALVGALLAYAAWCGLAAWRARRSDAPAHPLVFAVSAGAVAGALAVGLALGIDIRHPGLGIAPLLVALLCALGARGWGMALAGLTLTALVGIGIWIDLPAPWIGAHALVLLVAVGAGRGFARVLAGQSAVGAEQAARWQAWRSIASDLDWEMDSQFRFTRVADRGDRLDGAAATLRLDATPWEIEAIDLGDDAVDALRADLEAHLPFFDVPVARRDAQGQAHWMRLSGTPRFGADGSFAGYWGIGRDVSDEMRWRESALAAEARFRDLFERSPSPLVMLRKGLVLDANEAAVRLFGFAEIDAMQGFELATLFPQGPVRDDAMQRASLLEDAPIGESLPVIDHPMQTLGGRAISVQSTGVRVQTDSGPALLGIFFDSTGRKAVEQALRRSETLLLQLFATVPDVITLADLASDRYTMVNPSFTRMFGHASHTAMGRSSTELGLWPSA